MNPVITDCHFRSIGAAAGGRIATLAQSMGEWKCIITQIFFFFWDIRRILCSLIERTLSLLSVITTAFKK
jgi:hypothetical protein